MMEESSKNVVEIGQTIEILFPIKVYEDTGFQTPEGTALMILEAGFREKEDAELFVRAKTAKCEKKYVIRGSVQ